MITYAMLTNKGDRENNEDCIGMKEDKGAYCFVVADGLGGHERGEVASQLVVNEMKNMFHNTKNPENYLTKAFSTSQDKLRKYQQAQHAMNEMKTTAVLLAMTEDLIQWGHIGDSRLYFFKGNRIVKRTFDHSVPQMLVASGEIKEKDIRNHPDRNRVLRVMGNEWNVPKYELSETVKNKKKQSFLLCTDGFWELIDEKEMKRLLKSTASVEEWLNEMEKIVRENGKGTEMDNYSAIGVWVR